MKKLIAFIFVVFCNFTFLAQINVNNDLLWALHNYSGGPLHLILKVSSIDKFLSIASQHPSSVYVMYDAKDLVRCVVYDTSFLLQNFRNKNILRAEMFRPKRFKPLNDTMVVRNRILPVKQGLPPLTQAYHGSNVLFGLIDSGIDFSHPDFKDSTGKTRILNIWDQTVTNPTTTPFPFGYGQEWDSTSINNGSCTHSDLAYYGHGTHVAGIAAGNGRSTNTHQGCAPKSNIIAVALDFYLTAPVIADAVQYLVNKAISLNRPLSINASVGDYYGSHDATDLQSQMIVALISNVPGRIMSAAAGNAGNIKFHTFTNCNNNNDTLFTWIRNASTNVLEYWLYADTNDIKNIQLSVGVTNPAFQYLGNIGFQTYNYALSTIKHDTLKYNNKRIGIVHTSANINTSGVYEWYAQIQADSSNYLWSIESKGIGKHHAWNFDFVSSNLPSISQYPKIQHYVMPDTISSIVSGFQCSPEIITVANYVNLKQYYDYNNNLQTTTETAGQLAYHSSAGPTRTGLLKPDIAASGNSIFSCVAMGMRNNLIASSPNYLAPGGYHVFGGGTSAASPVVAGLAALYLQAYPNATNQQFKTALTNCAYTDVYTGTLLPNNKWGYGKVDGLATFTCSPLFNHSVQNNISVQIYPNPSNGQNIFIQTEQPIQNIYCTSILGKEVPMQVQYFSEEKVNISIAQKGVFIIKIITKEQNIHQKIIVY